MRIGRLLAITALLAALLVVAGPTPSADAHNSKCRQALSISMVSGYQGSGWMYTQNSHGTASGVVCSVGFWIRCWDFGYNSSVYLYRSASVYPFDGWSRAAVCNGSHPFFTGEYNYWAYHNGCTLC